MTIELMAWSVLTVTNVIIGVLGLALALVATYAYWKGRS
jgi:hypothetical protein